MSISLKGLIEQSEFCAFLFVLAAVLLNWPMLSLAEVRPPALGVPFVLVYVTIIWIVIIVLAYIFDRRHFD